MILEISIFAHNSVCNNFCAKKTNKQKNILPPQQKHEHEEERQCLPVVYEASAAGQQENVILQLSLQKQTRQRRHFDLFSLRSMKSRSSVSSASLSLLSSLKRCCFGLSSISRPALNTPLVSTHVKCIWTNVSCGAARVQDGHVQDTPWFVSQV